MKIILAQGNHGAKYDCTRHNVGFYILDNFVERHALNWSEKSKFNALTAETIIDDEKIMLVKPTTYYNETGISARRIVDFYSLDPAKDFLVIHDDLALPFGIVRTRKQGRDAGNNGIKSLNNHIGPDYHRIRIGIRSDLRDRMDDSDFVLSHFNKEELAQLESDIIPHAVKHITEFCHEELKITSHKTISQKNNSK
jgi:PTH1 family peptidyl-tRNA hydrolase